MNEETIAWCQRLVSCRSVTNEGTRTIAELCARELLSPLGIKAELVASQLEGADQVNLIATIFGRDSALEPLVLNTHLDTVPPGDPQAWTECGGDPFAAIVKDGRIYGVGAADTKLDFVAKVMGLATCGTPQRNVWLIATFGEERGLVGAKELAASSRLPRGGLAYIGEASHLEVITAHKGLMAFELRIDFTPAPCPSTAVQRIVFTGRSAHSSTPALGRNAILLALDALADHHKAQVVAIDGGDAVNKVPARCELLFAGAASGLGASPKPIGATNVTRTIPAEAVVALRQFTAALQGFADQAGPDEPDYASPTLTCNPGVIRTTDDSLVLEFELRPPPSLSLDEVRQGVATIAENTGCALANIEVEVMEKRANPGFRSNLNGPTVELAMRALANAGLPLKTNVKAGCTEAGVYAASGLEPVVFGPGPSTGVIHAPNEYNLLAEVEGAIRFYRELLRI